jgi:norsolorinic acid ketoreductase
MAEFRGTVPRILAQRVRDHYNTNLVGTLALFQAVYPQLVRFSEGMPPKLGTISSTVGSIGVTRDWPMNTTAYDTSKAVLNRLTKNIHIKNPGLIAFPIHPGYYPITFEYNKC